METRLLTPADLNPLTRAYPERPFSQLNGRLDDQSQGSAQFFSAWDGPMPIGYAMLYLIPEAQLPGLRGCACRTCSQSRQALDATGDPRVIDLLIHQARRRGGVGKMLMKVMEAQAMAMGFSGICLAVEISNDRARRLYQQRGFIQIGPEQRVHYRPSSGPDRGHLIQAPVLHLRKPLRNTLTNPQRSEELALLAAVDQAERANAPHAETLSASDLSRAQRVSQLLAEPDHLNGKDCYYAALIIHHTAQPTDGQAVGLALRAVQLGYQEGRWLVAAALDRFLVARGQEQHFGTQFQKTWRGWRLYPVRAATTDRDRARWDVAPSPCRIAV